MAGYTRQSVADIISGEVVKAAPLNAEFNALRDAFAFAGGHNHDGTSTEGAYIGLIADTDGNNKVVVDTANNRVGIFAEVGGSAVEQIRIQDGAIVPVTDDDIDLGASGAEFKNLYIDGTANIDALVSAAVTLTGGTIDGTTIGATTPAAGTFTTVTTTGQATLATADINGGTVDGTVIGGATPGAGTFTNLTSTTGITGTLTGNVTGNVTGNLTGNVTGNLVGDVTGNVTASSGASAFNNVTVNGTLDVTGTTIANVTDPVSAQDAATKNYVDTEVAALVDSAPGALNTLNELAAAIGDDANFSTTITNSIATKLPLAGGTMSGAIAMGTSKITGMGDPTANQDAATKAYVDTNDASQLSLSGGTMTGAIDMGANKITTTYTPTNNADLTTKTYVDGILGSATAAATSAANAATSASNAATSETNAGNSATAAASSATNAATSYDNFDDRFLGAKASDPTLDNDGDALITGAIYFNTTNNKMKVYTGSAWQDVAPVATSVTVSQISDLTATAAELNTLDGITSTVTELNTLDGITSTVTELNHTDGVTSNIQTQLDAKVDDSQIGTSANQLVQLDGSARLPAVDGSQLTNLPSAGATAGFAVAMAIAL